MCDTALQSSDRKCGVATAMSALASAELATLFVFFADKQTYKASLTSTGPSGR